MKDTRAKEIPQTQRIRSAAREGKKFEFLGVADAEEAERMETEEGEIRSGMQV